MNNKALTLSLVMAAIAVFFVQSYVSSVEESYNKKYGTRVLVLVAKKDIKEMETVNETMLEFTEIPKKFLEPATISLESKDEESKEKSKTLKGLTGSIAVVPIKKGEQLTFNKLTDPSIRTGLAPQIAPGRRAIAIPVDEKTAVSKLVKPGDRIDLIAIVDMGGGKENKVAKTILQDVVVLSIGKYITNNVPRVVEADPVGGRDRVKSLAEDFTFATITLEVDPIQAQTVALLMNSSDNAISVSLRNNDDIDRVNFPSTTLPDIFGADAFRGKAGAPKR